MKTSQKNILKLFIVITIYISIIILAWITLKYYKLNNISTIRDLCNNNAYGYIIFILLQIFQVVFLPINSIIFVIPAIIVFGAIKAFVLCYVGLIIGSIIMFFIGRIGGIKILSWIVGKDKALKYKFVLGKGKFMLPIFMLLAIIPDDLLCVSAGLSNIDFGYFLLVILATRGIDLACTCFIGIHAIKSTIGIICLFIFVTIAVILSLILTKRQDQLESWIIKTFTKNKAR